MKTKLFLASAAIAVFAMPAYGICSIDDGAPKGGGKSKKPEVKKVATWIYPEDGSEGQIVQMKPGAKCPEGFAFAPCEKAADEKALNDDDLPDAGDREAEITDLNDQLQNAQARIKELETEAENAAGAGSERIVQLEADMIEITRQADEKIKELEAEVEELKNPKDVPTEDGTASSTDESDDAEGDQSDAKKTTKAATKK